MKKQQSTRQKSDVRREKGGEKRNTGGHKETTRGPRRGSVTTPPWELDKRPIVALVGRPNVGKSTLFNRIAGGRAAIVEDRPGTTRDRRYANAEWDGRPFMICDTGGFEPEPDQPILKEMRRQTQHAIEEADVVVFVADAKAGLNPSDTEIAERLRRSKKPVIVVVNKVDGPKQEALAMELYALGLGDIKMLSAAHGIGVNDLLDEILSRLPPLPPPPILTDEEIRTEARRRLLEEFPDEPGSASDVGGDGDGDGDADGDGDGDDSSSSESDSDSEEIDDSVSYEADDYDPNEFSSDAYDDGASHPEAIAAAAEEFDSDPRARPSDLIEPEPGNFREPEPDDGITRIAVIGRPNAGKSTLINRLLGEERLLTFHEAGTTRDAIDTWLEKNGSRYLLIDTAGIRRQRSVHDPLEKLCISRALDAVDRADVAWLMIDATAGITEQDAKVASFAHEKGKGIVLVLNKWDLTAAGPKASQKLHEDIERKLSYLKYAPIVTVSARTGAHVDKLLKLTDKVALERKSRVPTGKLNRFFRDVLERHTPPTQSGRLIKLLYITQVATKPPVFLVSVNYPKSVHFSYQRYVVNQLRKAFGFEGVPLRVFYRKRERRA